MRVAAAAGSLRPTAATLLLFSPPQLRHGRRPIQHLPFARRRRHSSTATVAAPTLDDEAEGKAAPPPDESKAGRRRRARESPEGLLRHQLDMCSRHADLTTALRLYDAALSPASPVPLSLHHYNCLLYLCSNAAASASDPDAAKRGFDIFARMEADGVQPNEATLTSVARLAAATRDPAMAFSVVRRMAQAGIPPRLRSYGPALFAYCDAKDADGASQVETHMEASAVVPEEPELAALLRVNADNSRADEVYRLLHRTRALVRQVCETTAQVVEAWFQSNAAAETGVDKWDASKVKEGVLKGGGGWHGQGWLGRGQWSVGRSHMDKDGTCQRCRERLVCIDIDPSETENFANSLVELASKREVKEDFLTFQRWLRRHGPFDAVIDAANVGLYNSKVFSFSQVNSVVNAIQKITKSKKLPLIILHRNRVNNGPAKSPHNQKILESWRNAGALYATPPGSNDDWYWLYAAVSCRSLLVTNDEMRDHLFQLLGTSFFPRWKEKHQVRLTFSGRGPTLHLPPPYSIVIQESEDGSWHVPTTSGDDIEQPREWICANRKTSKAGCEVEVNGASQNSSCVSHVIHVWAGQPIEACHLSYVLPWRSTPTGRRPQGVVNLSQPQELHRSHVSLSLCFCLASSAQQHHQTHPIQKKREKSGLLDGGAWGALPHPGFSLMHSRFHLKQAAPTMAAPCFSSVAVTSSSSRSRRMPGCRPEPPRFLVVSCDTRTAAADVYSSLAAKILGPPTTFNAAKLKVEFAGEDMMTRSKKQPFPRAYTLTHCDFTANLTLAVTGSITSEQLRSWQSTLQRDDVVAEWKEMATGEMTLHVHCYVSGANLLQELAAGFRYYVFSKELPLVLKAVVYGDATLFAERPELMEAKVWVHFHSSSRKYNRIECWGPLKEATKRNLLDGRFNELQNAITKRRRKWGPDTIFNALVALLL
ncbi:hypothetical protein EJB05_40306, partial [Eragrostis curvula]